MVRLHKEKRNKIFTLILVFSMILGVISPGMTQVKAEETQEETTVWNFRGGQEGAFSGEFQGNNGIGEFQGIQIDATNGKLAARGQGDTQMNAGTKLVIPVSGSAIIAVKTHQSYYNYTIDGESATGGNFEHEYKGGEGTVVIEATGSVYLHEISRTYTKAEEPEEETPEELPESDLIDVWDFGAEQLDGYNNKLTVDIINGLYPEGTPVGEGKTIPGFSIGDGELIFNDGGHQTTHRLRTNNKNLIRYDSRSLNFEGVDGALTGYLYSNKGSTKDVYLGISLREGDIVTLLVASNGGKSTVHMEAPSGKSVSQVYNEGGSTASKMVFYAAEAGLHKIYSVDEKLVVARVYREYTKPVKVSGTIDAPEGLSDYSISFTNDKTGAVISAKVVDGKYQVSLREQYTYQVGLSNANGYIITSGKSIEIPKGSESRIYDIAVQSVPLVTLTGKITGLSENALDKLMLQFVPKDISAIYLPEIVVQKDGTYTLSLEKGIEYALVAEGVNDYTLLGEGSLFANEDIVYDFVFEEKVKYPVDIKLTGIEEEVRNSAFITFANINEKGYEYTFPMAGQEISLRDGQYRITVSGIGKYPVSMAISPDVKVDGTGAEATVNFNTITSWKFGALNKEYGGAGIEKIQEESYYSGLQLSSTGVVENKGYLLMNAGGSIKIPVKAKDLVSISYCYSAAFQIEGTETKVDESSGSTAKIDTISYEALEDGFLTLAGFKGEIASQTYLTQIMVVSPVERKEVITVGKTGSDYATIGKALEAVRNMSRPNKERVVIEIQPGNYEEMLVVDVPNITLKNASKNPSIALTDKGVGIAKEAVRITSYYGHGYSYYSMGTDGKYDAKALEANKANGYLSYHNPGSGTTNGSYWNATAVILADGFTADGIIFENSFNQYISEKEAQDILVLESGNKGERSRVVGDTSVQHKKFVERAAALAIGNNVKEAYFDHCRFVGRQDTLFGGENVTAAFYKSAIMGGTDYIFGGMTAVFNQCELVLNTSEDNNDVAYITAAQQKTGRGYLMYRCTVTSTTPGVDTASEKTSKPGYLGRPWQAGTSEVVFYETKIGTTDFSGKVESLIIPQAWGSGLGGESRFMYEYDSKEEAEGIDYSRSRVAWSTVLTEPKLLDGTELTTKEIAIKAFLGDWKPFEVETTNPEEPQEPEEPQKPQEPQEQESTGSSAESEKQPEDVLSIKAPVNSDGSVNWEAVNIAIEEKLEKFSAADTKTLFVEINMGKSTILGGELVEAIQGKQIKVTLTLESGVVWSINGEDLAEQKYNDVDLAVELGTNAVPKTAVEGLGVTKERLAGQISLAHKGEFGFTAELSLDLEKLNSKLTLSEVKNQIAAVYYHNPRTGELNLQSAGRIDTKGNAVFCFSHASDYVVLISEKLLIDETTKNSITVNGVLPGKTAKRTMYVGGTIGAADTVEIILPDGIKDAVEQNLIDYRVVCVSNNRKTAIVSKKGAVTARAVGDTTLRTTIQLDGTTFAYDTLISVNKASVKIVKGPSVLTQGKKATYQAEVLGYRTEDVVWMTSKKNIAVIGKNKGKLTATATAKTAGKEKVFIRVAGNNGSYVEGKIEITVK